MFSLVRRGINFFSLLILLIVLVFYFFSCVEDQNSYRVRLNNFKNLLSEEAKGNFDQGNLEEVAKYLREEIARDEEFEKKLFALKDFESINFFDNEQLVRYFYENFQQRKIP